MRLLLVMLLTLSLTFMGCAASQEEVLSYHKSVQETNMAIVASIEKQAEDNKRLKTEEMEAFSRSMAQASLTPDPTDNAVIAFAWGFASGQKRSIEIPGLQYPRSPVTSVDALKAWTPIVGMAVPLVTPLLYGYGAFGSGSGSGAQDIVATDNATIYLDSGNTNSQNAVRDGSTFSAEGSSTVNQHDDYTGGASGPSVTPLGADGECPFGYSLRESTGECITVECEAWIDGGSVGVQPGSCGDVVAPVLAPEQPIAGDTCDVTGGYLGLDGRLYADPSFTCSCGSRSAGNC